MTMYYVRKSGSNANNGLTPATAWLTVNKATNNNASVLAGDTVYVGAGVYREVLTFGTYTSTVTIAGDVDGSKTGDTGEVQITAWLTDNKTAPSSSTLLGLNGSFNNWSFKNIVFVSGSGNARMLQFSDNVGIAFTDCAFISLYPNNVTVMSLIVTTTSAKNWLFDRCRFMMLGGISITLPSVATADYDANIIFRNCVIDTHTAIGLDIAGSGALAGKGGGVYIYNCFIRAGSPVIRIITANTSTTYPVKIENSIIYGSHNSTALSGLAAGQIVESYNIINAATPRNANVAVGTGSISNGSYNILFHMGQEMIYGGQLRPPYMPTALSGMLGFGSSGNGPTVAITGATRPAGGESASYAAGPYERSNTWTRETTTVRTGSNAISVVGPGFQDFMVPVDATSTTVSVYIRWDGTYAGTKPSMSILNGADIGVANATATATGSSGAWEQLSLAFTPTAKGIVTIRLVSSSTAAAGKAFCDDFAVT